MAQKKSKKSKSYVHHVYGGNLKLGLNEDIGKSLDTDITEEFEPKKKHYKR